MNHILYVDPTDNGRLVVNEEVAWFGKESVVTYFKVLSYYSLEETGGR
jgi:hypothetical protein